jgi:hypothetical protein
LSGKRDEEDAQLQRAAEAAARLQQSLQQERARAEALAAKLAKTQQEVETQAVLSSKKDNEAAQLKRAAEAAAGLQQSLQQERARAEAVAAELAKAQQEVKSQAALSSKKDEEAAQLKRATETLALDLKQSLQRERDKTLALENELAMARRGVETEMARSQKAADETTQIPQTTKKAQTDLRGSIDPALPREANSSLPPLEKRSLAVESKSSPEAAKLLERANALISGGNIGAARTVLERAADAGSAQATFKLAETYDPLVLSTWRTHGTLGDATKARELYATAYDGGIKAAKDRSEALLRFENTRRP